MSGMRQGVYLVRHGESEWNRRGLTQGQTASPALTETGRRQARAAADHLRTQLSFGGARSVRIVTSDLARAFETATIIAEVLPVPLAADARLRERHLGVWQGRDYASTQAWLGLDEEPGRAPDGGESLNDVRVRAGAALAELDPAHTHVVVTHGEVIRALLTPSATSDHARSRVVDNGAVLRWPRP
jgi:probable phosphoglycerate mutase